jgi:hypothetical protein
VQSPSNLVDDLLSNQMLFNTGQLSPGQHELVVTYLGSNATSPMILNYFVQQDGPLALASPTSSNTPTSTSVPSGTNSSPSTIHMKPTGAIIGGVIGGLFLISLLQVLLALFFFLRRRKALSKPHTVPSPDVVNPFTVSPSNPTSTFLPQNYTSNGQFEYISSKFTQRGQPSDPASMSSSGGPGILPLTILRPEFSSPSFISPSSPRLPLTGLQTNLDGTGTRVPQTTTEPSLQRSLSPQTNARFLRHEDSGVRIPPAEDDVVELPPFYTPG